MSNVTYADSESESVCGSEKVYIVTVVTLECIKCKILPAGHLLCRGWIKFTGVREQPHRGAARQTQEVSGQEEVLVLESSEWNSNNLGSKARNISAEASIFVKSDIGR